MIRRNRLDGAAQGLVEFALVLPVLLFAMFMFIDVSRAAYAYLVLTNAVREAVRLGVVDCTTNSDGSVTLGSYEAVKEAVVGRAYGVGPAPTVSQVDVALNQVRREYSQQSRDEYFLVVSLNYTFQPVTPYLVEFLAGGPLVIQVAASMQVE